MTVSAGKVLRDDRVSSLAFAYEDTEDYYGEVTCPKPQYFVLSS